MKRYTRRKQLTDLWSVLRQPSSGWVSANLARRLAQVALQERTAIPCRGGAKGDRRCIRRTKIDRHLSVTDDRIGSVVASRARAVLVAKIVPTTAMNTRQLATIKR